MDGESDPSLRKNIQVESAAVLRKKFDLFRPADIPICLDHGEVDGAVGGAAGGAKDFHDGLVEFGTQRVPNWGG